MGWFLMPRMVVGGGPLTSASITGSTWGSGTALTITSFPATDVSIVGGSGSYSFLWERVSGLTSVTANAPNAQSTTFSSTWTGTLKGERQAVFRCRVTDNVSGLQVYTNNVTVTLTRI